MGLSVSSLMNFPTAKSASQFEIADGGELISNQDSVTRKAGNEEDPDGEVRTKEGEKGKRRRRRNKKKRTASNANAVADTHVSSPAVEADTEIDSNNPFSPLVIAKPKSTPSEAVRVDTKGLRDEQVKFAHPDPKLMLKEYQGTIEQLERLLAEGIQKYNESEAQHQLAELVHNQTQAEAEATLQEHIAAYEMLQEEHDAERKADQEKIEQLEEEKLELEEDAHNARRERSYLSGVNNEHVTRIDFLEREMGPERVKSVQRRATEYFNSQVSRMKATALYNSWIEKTNRVGEKSSKAMSRHASIRNSPLRKSFVGPEESTAVSIATDVDEVPKAAETGQFLHEGEQDQDSLASHSILRNTLGAFVFMGIGWIANSEVLALGLADVMHMRVGYHARWGPYGLQY